MFSTTRVTATVGISAMGASLALAVGMLGPSAVPVAGQSAAESSVSPVVVTGTSSRITLEDFGEEAAVGGVPVLQGNTTVSAPEMDDPRVSGTYRLIQSGQNHGGAGPMWGTMRVENADGAWEGPVDGWWTDTDTHFIGCLAGEQAYEGFTYCLQAAADVVLMDVAFDGLIYEGGLPPAE